MDAIQQLTAVLVGDFQVALEWWGGRGGLEGDPDLELDDGGVEGDGRDMEVED